MSNEIDQDSEKKRIQELRGTAKRIYDVFSDSGLQKRNPKVAALLNCDLLGKSGLSYLALLEATISEGVREKFPNEGELTRQPLNLDGEECHTIILYGLSEGKHLESHIYIYDDPSQDDGIRVTIQEPHFQNESDDGGAPTSYAVMALSEKLPQFPSVELYEYQSVQPVIFPPTASAYTLRHEKSLLKG